MKYLSWLFSALLLSACGSSVPEGAGGFGFKSMHADKASDLNLEIDRRCQSLAGGTAAASFDADELCPNCSAENENQALDAADATFASLRAGLASPGTLTLRATAQPGTVFAEGSNAAVTLSAEPANVGCVNGVCALSSSSQNWRLTLRTYLDGALQEEDVQFISIDTDPDSRQIVGITTALSFNAIEAAFDRIGIYPMQGQVAFNGSDYLEPGNALVHEFCSDFDLTGLQ